MGASIVGIFALLKDKMSYLWIIYCMALAVLCLAVFVGSVSTLSHQIEHVEEHMNESIDKYQDYSRGNTGWNNTELKKLIDMVDNVQERHDVS